LQMTMSFLLGWFAEHRSIAEAFALLGLLYAMAAFAALRTRTAESAVRSIPFPPPAV